ncbi:MAG: orotidine-5'-phosphate decarboxylase [Gammaproteobacteria bacterium]|nr:MAG: orotidine-5'-phosphate decarboxylase [Gammaproteobacteria bacterium]
MSESRVIVALDYPSTDEAHPFISQVHPAQCRLKVGLELFTAAGPQFVAGLVKQGFEVFLDLKYHDIPTTVARACAQAAQLGVWMLSVHALGGRTMLRSAREAIEGAERRPLLIAATLLTSHTARDIADIGLTDDIGSGVRRLAELAREAGMDGAVCAPQEAAALREQFGKKLILVTPGIRPAAAPGDDQRRAMTPAEAIAQGADYLVIGRPITRTADPQAALEEINREIAS